MSRPYKIYWTETEGKGEEDHISIHAPYLLCLSPPPVKALQPSAGVFFIKSTDSKRRKCILSKHFFIWRRSRRPVLRYALVFLFVHSSESLCQTIIPSINFFIYSTCKHMPPHLVMLPQEWVITRVSQLPQSSSFQSNLSWWQVKEMSL